MKIGKKTEIEKEIKKIDWIIDYLNCYKKQLEEGITYIFDLNSIKEVVNKKIIDKLKENDK